MNTFRTLSESRSFISLSLLLLLITTFIPICHAETGRVGIDHQLNHSSSDDEHAVEFSHTDETPDRCCNDLTTQVILLPALVSSAIGDTGFDAAEIPVELEPLITSPHNISGISGWPGFHFKPPGLPIYLHTQRLRI